MLSFNTHAFVHKEQGAINLLTLVMENIFMLTSHTVKKNQNLNEEREQMVLRSISDENNDNTAAGSDLIPPAPRPNCAALNMESNDAVKMFIF